MNQYKIWSKMFIFLLFFSWRMSSAQSSENYSLNKSVLDVGGGSAASESYFVQDAVGQPGVVGTLSSEIYHSTAGYFPGSLETTAVGKKENAQLPEQFQLYQNYPNPFNPETTINFDVKEPCEVKLSVYDMLGREIGVLVNNHYKPGAYQVSFNALAMPSGIYVYRIRMGEFNAVKKMIILE